MADPLSIAGSVVGITAAGVQASIKLYALAEKVATASQRVTSIANDISSTCAILNQVRELVIPQPDAQGTLKSVFNSVALGDISHALHRCRSVFTDIETLLGNAFEQVGKRSTLHSNIKLSRFEKAKWPFLQPQFDDLRNDLREAKGNLVLMIAVASLALAQRDGRQRPIHERERLELGSTIVQLQRARTIRPQDRNIPEHSQQQKRSLRKLFGMHTSTDTNRYLMSERNQGMDSRHLSASGSLNSATAFPRTPRQDVGSSFIINDWAHGVPPTNVETSPEDTLLSSIRDRVHQKKDGPSTSSLSTEGKGTTLATLDTISPPLASVIRKAPDASESLPEPYPREPHAREPSTEEQKFHTDSTGSTSLPVPDVVVQLAQEEPEVTFVPNTLASPSSTASASDGTRRYHGWATKYLEGLKSGRGTSLSLELMSLPDRSLERLVKKYTDEGNDAHIAMSELTAEQQQLIKQTCLPFPDAEVAYVNVQHNVTVSSVFGILNIVTLKWIVASRTLPPTTSLPEIVAHWGTRAKSVGSAPLISSHGVSHNWRKEDTDRFYVQTPDGSTSPTPPRSVHATENESIEPMEHPKGHEPEYERFLELERRMMTQRKEVTAKYEGVHNGCAFDTSFPEHFDEEQLELIFDPEDLPRRGGHGDRGYEVPTITPESHDLPIETSTMVRPSTTWFPRFRRQRIHATPPLRDTEKEEGDEIVNELLARWTTS